MLSATLWPASGTKDLSAKAKLITQAELAGVFQGRERLREAVGAYANVDEAFALKPALGDLFKATEMSTFLIWFRLRFENANVEPGPFCACIGQVVLITDDGLPSTNRLGVVISVTQ